MKVIDVKPRNISAIDIKPKMSLVSQETVMYLESRTLGAGQPIGPGLYMIYTYPQSSTFTVQRP